MNYGGKLMKMKTFVFIFIVFTFSCQTKGYLETFDKEADGWLNWPPEDEFFSWGWSVEPANITIIFIEDEKLYEAADRLKDIFFIKLSDEEYYYYTSKYKKEIDNAYLIRSVNYAFNENGYEIFLSQKNNLLIHHRTMGSGKWKGVQKWPIIIIFNEMEKIDKIFTSYSVVK